MDTFVFSAVLFAAACHAGWNATIKRGLDPLIVTVLISVGAAVVAAACWPFVGLPAPSAWPFVIASIFVSLPFVIREVAPVLEGDHIVGLLDESDLLLAATRDQAAFRRPVRDFMSSADGKGILKRYGFSLAKE